MVVTVAAAACGDDGPQKLAKGTVLPSTIAIDDRFVYWNDAAEGLRVPKQGGELERLGWGDCSGGMAADEEALYCSGLGVSISAWVGRKVTATGVEETIFAEDYPDVEADQIVIDDAFVYVAVVDVSIGDGETHEGSIHKVPKAGGGSIELARGMRYSVALAVDDTSLYWVDWYTGELWKVPKDGGAPVLLASGFEEFSRIAVYGSSVYVTTNGTDAQAHEDGAVWSVPIEGGTPVRLVDEPGARNIHADAIGLVWSAAGSERLPENDGWVRAMTWGGEPYTIADRQILPWEMTADDTHAYWVTIDGDVYRAAR